MNEYLNEDILGFGESPFKMTITYDQIDNMTKLGLLGAIENIEKAGQFLDQEMLDAYDALNGALSWFTSPKEQEALTTRPIPSDFLDRVVYLKGLK